MASRSEEIALKEVDKAASAMACTLSPSGPRSLFVGFQCSPDRSLGMLVSFCMSQNVNMAWRRLIEGG